TGVHSGPAIGARDDDAVVEAAVRADRCASSTRSLDRRAHAGARCRHARGATAWRGDATHRMTAASRRVWAMRDAQTQRPKTVTRVPRERSSVRGALLGPCLVAGALSGLGLDLAGFTRLDVMAAPAELPEDARLLDLSLERLERPLEAIGFVEMN